MKIVQVLFGTLLVVLCNGQEEPWATEADVDRDADTEATRLEDGDEDNDCDGIADAVIQTNPDTRDLIADNTPSEEHPIMLNGDNDCNDGTEYELLHPGDGIPERTCPDDDVDSEVGTSDWEFEKVDQVDTDRYGPGQRDKRADRAEHKIVLRTIFGRHPHLVDCDDTFAPTRT